ncbi:hypothetical protein Z947_1466 [Sulfitobacter geojensis]|nr:hypothetical protein Z947_1466 [Sulfitobacter geojensis]
MAFLTVSTIYGSHVSVIGNNQSQRCSGGAILLGNVVNAAPGRKRAGEKML